MTSKSPRQAHQTTALARGMIFNAARLPGEVFN